MPPMLTLLVDVRRQCIAHASLLLSGEFSIAHHFTQGSGRIPCDTQLVVDNGSSIIRDK